MTLRQALMIVCISTFSCENVHCMAVVAKAFKAMSVIEQKPEYEFPVRRTIGSFSCYDGSMALLFSKLHSRRLYHFPPPYLFLNSSYKDVSLFIQELVQDTSAFVMEFDCSKNWNTISLYERNEDMKRVFKRAASLYEQTHKPVIIHCYNLEGGLARGEQNLSWNFESDQIEDKNIILFSSTETSGELLHSHFLQMNCQRYTIQDKKVYALMDYNSLQLNLRIKMYNYAAHAINVAIIGGLAVSSVMYLVATYKARIAVDDPEEN